MRRAVLGLVCFGLLGAGLALLSDRAEACVTPRWGDNTCSCISSTVGKLGCGTDGRSCTSWGQCNGQVILPF